MSGSMKNQRLIEHLLLECIKELEEEVEEKRMEQRWMHAHIEKLEEALVNQKRVAELEAENKRLLDQLERTQGYVAEREAKLMRYEAAETLVTQNRRELRKLREEG